jgi:hypothetical protein
VRPAATCHIPPDAQPKPRKSSSDIAQPDIHLPYLRQPDYPPSEGEAKIIAHHSQSRKKVLTISFLLVKKVGFIQERHRQFSRIHALSRSLRAGICLFFQELFTFSTAHPFRQRHLNTY